MANFGVTNSSLGMGGGNAQQATTGTYKSMILLGASTQPTSVLGAGMMRRGKIYDMLVGTNVTPADAYMEYDLARITLSTTATGITGTMLSSLSSTYALDIADNNGFVTAFSINSTGEVGVVQVSELWYVGVNQRASYRWVAAPGSEFVWPAASSATGSNGFALRARSGGTPTVTANILFQEQ